MKYRLTFSFAFVALCGLASSVFASGTVSQPQRMPGSPSSTINSDAYARGKQIYLEKIVCDACPVAGGVQDKAGATALVERINAKEFALSWGERWRVKAYLKNRFRSN